MATKKSLSCSGTWPVKSRTWARPSNSINSATPPVIGLLVVDGTRARTLEIARSIQQRVVAEIGERPFLALVNKVDLRDTWEIPDTAWPDLAATGWNAI